MGRFALFMLALLGVAAALLTAVLLPVHLRAVSPRVLEESNRQGKSLVQLAGENAPRNPAVAKVLLRAAEELNLDGTESVLETLREGAEVASPARTVLQELERASAGRVQTQDTPVLTALRRKNDRETLARSLRSPDAVRVLRNRTLTNLTVFAPAGSAAGHPLDAAILSTAFLIEQGAFGANASADSTFKDEILQLSARGTSTNQVAALEDLYLDMFALSKRLSSEQLIAFVSSIPNYRSFDHLARLIQEQPRIMPLVFSSVVVSRDGTAVSKYLSAYPRTALKDLGFGLSVNGRALTALLAAQKPIYRAEVHNMLISARGLAFAANPLLRFASAYPKFAIVVKWACLLAAGLLLTYAVRLARPVRDEEEWLDWTPQFDFSRRLTFAVVFLALTVLLGEPYLAQGEAEEKPAPRVRFPILSALAPQISKPQPKNSGSMINASTLIAMGVFLVLQGSIYVFCLTKLAEIHRQPLSGPMKLRLLENEENLFDSGLYLGLFGTAASLILLTLGLIKPSLVSAYSSTLFGILFVALLKIFHVRPYRRRLIIESATDEEGS